MPDLFQHYQDVLVQNRWAEDAAQRKAVVELQRLSIDIKSQKSFWPFSKKKNIKGVYLYGGAGRGKSMLMDLFFEHVPDKIKKRRVHFHEFMIETHDWLHDKRGDQMDDLLPAYARHVAKQNKLLCFDEFHVTDVADAMILGRLFTALIEQGVVVVTTSNWAPDNLYEGGLQRDLFMPFIALFKERLNIVHLDSDTDYRQISDPDQDIYYFHPLDKDTYQKIDHLFAELTNNQKITPKIIEVKGRNLEIKAAGDIARTTFSQLCEQPLGAEDYIQIANEFDTVFVENIPTLTADKRNEAKRFILLIDCLYEAKCRLVLSAENDIHHLYTGDDHAFEFHRTISRLMEMQSKAYHAERLKHDGAS
jgi:cell division protein ZapE